MSTEYDLLAVIHRDGGHYTEQHGFSKSVEDAIGIIYKDRSRIEDLSSKLSALIDATEDKNGQFKAWHQHLRKVTQEAKELLNSTPK